MTKIEAFRSSLECPSALSAAVGEAVSAVTKAFEDFPDRLVISLNGGKDCVVVVHLVHAVHAKLLAEGKSRAKMKAFYIREKDPFKVKPIRNPNSSQAKN